MSLCYIDGPGLISSMNIFPFVGYTLLKQLKFGTILNVKHVTVFMYKNPLIIQIYSTSPMLAFHQFRVCPRTGGARKNIEPCAVNIFLLAFVIRCNRQGVVLNGSVGRTSVCYTDSSSSSRCPNTFRSVSYRHVLAIKIGNNIKFNACDIFLQKKNPIIIQIYSTSSMLYFHYFYFPPEPVPLGKRFQSCAVFIVLSIFVVRCVSILLRCTRTSLHFSDCPCSITYLNTFSI